MIQLEMYVVYMLLSSIPDSSVTVTLLSSSCNVRQPDCLPPAGRWRLLLCQHKQWPHAGRVGPPEVQGAGARAESRLVPGPRELRPPAGRASPHELQGRWGARSRPRLGPREQGPPAWRRGAQLLRADLRIGEAGSRRVRGSGGHGGNWDGCGFLLFGGGLGRGRLYPSSSSTGYRSHSSRRRCSRCSSRRVSVLVA
jgi:hypothetical protein